MGFGFGGCGFDRCDCCIGGYGDGPCGGYYSYWDRFCGPRECGRGRCGCSNECGRGRCCGPNECGRGRCGCQPGFPNCGCFPFLGCGPNWRNPRCGLFLNVPCGCCNLGFFLPF